MDATAAKLLSVARRIPQRFARLTSSPNYIPQLDGIRVLAILPVLVWHAGLRGSRSVDAGLPDYLPHGQVGVLLFFFISGLVIAGPFMAGRAPSYWAFVGRRLARLHPPYLAVLIICGAILALGYRPQNTAHYDRAQLPLEQSIAGALFYLHGLLFGRDPKINPPLWSLEIEMQFYLVAPLLLGAYLAVKRQGLRIAIGLAAVLAGLVMAETIQEWTVWPSRLRHLLAYYGFIFIFGIVVADYASTAKPLQKSATRAFDLSFVAGCGLLALVGYFEHIERSAPFTARCAADVAALASFLLIYLGVMRGRVCRRLFGLPWMALIGGACYSLYLVHVPVMEAVAQVLFRLVYVGSEPLAVALSLLLALPAAVAAGLVFYVLVERPFMAAGWPRRLFLRNTSEPSRPRRQSSPC